MPSFRPALLVASLAFLSACRAERITLTDASITASTDQVWSGGTLILASAAFRGADTTPVVMVGAETLAVRPIGAESLLVQLPDTNGPIGLSVRLRGRPDATLGPFHAHGFIAAGIGPRLSGTPYPWPSGGGAPTGLGYQDGRLVLVDYRYNTAAPLIADTALGPPCHAGPVPSTTDPSLVVVASHAGTGCGPLIATPIPPGASPPDTGPPPSYYFAAMQLGRGHWLINRKYYTDLVVRTPAGGFTTLAANLPGDEMSGFVVSPRGDRVALLQAQALGGAPVFEPTGPSIAYRLTDFDVIGGVAFSEAGDTMFAAGVDPNGSAWFLAVDADSGHVVCRASLNAAGMGSYVSASSVAIDPNRPWVYVADERDGRPYVDVFDRTTLAMVAQLKVPATAVPDNIFLQTGDYVLVTSPLERRLYLTINYAASSAPGPSLATYVLRFDLLP